MAAGAGESQLQGKLGPALTEPRVRQGQLEDVEDMLEKGVNLLSRADLPHGSGDVLVLPEGLTFSGKI